MISKEELYILSYYRASELAGSILFGRLAFVTTLDSIRIPLTRHCLEETEHAWLWTKTIKDLGKIPLKITETYQTEYGKEFGLPENILEILCLTHVLEKRTLSHYMKHFEMQNIHPLIKQMLKKIIEDEKGHVGWIEKELNKYAEKNGKENVDKIMKRAMEVDEKAYKKIANKQPFKKFFGGSL